MFEHANKLDSQKNFCLMNITIELIWMDSNQVEIAKYISKSRLQGEEAAGWRELLQIFFETRENDG